MSVLAFPAPTLLPLAKFARVRGLMVLVLLPPLLRTERGGEGGCERDIKDVFVERNGRRSGPRSERRVWETCEVLVDGGRGYASGAREERTVVRWLDLVEGGRGMDAGPGGPEMREEWDLEVENGREKADGGRGKSAGVL